MRIAVVGAGNSGCAQTCKLIQNGHSVNLIKTSNSLHNDNFECILSKGYIECLDTTDSNRLFKVKPNLITKDIEDGLSDVDAVLILTQSLQHRDLAPRLARYFRDGQIVFIIPGNLGSVMFKKYTDKNVVFVEGESTPYDARIIKPGMVEILFKNVRNAVSFYNNSDVEKLSVVDALFGRHKFLRSNLVESALHNPNMVVHTIGAIMSASRIERMKGEFWMYKEAFTPSIWNLIGILDKEKIAVIESYGGENAISYLDACKWRNEEDLSQDSLSVFNMYANTGGPKGPSSLNTRYIYEDVPMELCLMENLGKNKGISTPLTSALITIASSLLQKDFRSIAYSIDDLSDYLCTLG